ncbi:NodT family efflux transporter outer membrane factor (OMF) lipoprotein [Novosphingobium sp. SG751A]|uniref:efflux transporter outer membrane subunit n=1 Tax=Novosphingobium sp. SG751A TaxID=2587000 RepID=UPI001558131C|nr:efflux transporter outer membrane subunit [Novosphingobium sp. SG751A]NOW48461.1 NodT family efflux transporter outer membrane factor (OMF) lipoprotein [Novosphingobium sp. SG751A]
MSHSRFIPRIAVLALCASMAACVSDAHRQPSVAVPTGFSDHKMAATAGEEALDAWWLLFNDEQLTALVNQALGNAPDARTAIAVLQQAQATRATAMNRFSLQGAATGSRQDQQNNTQGVPGYHQTTYTGAFSPSWELGLFGREDAMRRAANADLDAARFQYEASRQSLASSVAGDLIEARANAIRLQQARETLRVAQELARVGDRRAALGLASPADAASLTADVATARANVRAIAVRLEIARRTLLVLLGRGTEPIEVIPIAAELTSAPAIPAATPASLLVRRPDIRQAEARLRSAAGTLTLNARELLPTVSLSASGSFTKLIGPAGYATALWSLGEGLALPVLNRPRLLAQVRGQRARTEQAVIAYENAVQSGFAEAQNALTTYAGDQARLKDLAQAEERARFAFSAQAEGYRRGVVDLSALLQAERTWRANLASLSDLRAGTLTDSVNLFRALGGGWPASQQAGTNTAKNEKDS